MNRFKTYLMGLVCIWASTGALAAHAQAVVEYIHTDALGTPIAITDVNRNVIERSEYEPFGQLLNRPLTDGPGFTGHVQDAATGLTYMQQRYYDSLLGRFLSVDPVTAYSSPGANFNRYWYANNNPYKFVDMDGRKAATRICEDEGCKDRVPRKGEGVIAHNGRDKGVPINPGTAEIRYKSAVRAVSKIQIAVQGMPNDSYDDAAKTHRAAFQQIAEEYGVEIETTTRSSVEGYRLDGATVGNTFRKGDGIGFTVNSPSNGEVTNHSHPLPTTEGDYPPFSTSDVHWMGPSPGIPHYVTNPEGVFRYDGAGKSVQKVGGSP